MIFTPTELDGAYVVDIEPREDERGFFARAWAREEFAEHGLSTAVVQANVAFNRRKGTLRGMHFQRDPHAEVKVVRCTRGALSRWLIGWNYFLVGRAGRGRPWTTHRRRTRGTGTRSR